ncbi:undecaprenyl-diphosphate phosphatase [Microcella indica]|uniref:undecaprenyl-diphosphate phosphatase n=1 Tax=Microcella indica TaxID=2750620 RepID=UPI0015CF6AA3|nr:undecaprenyl-diphosphate phosphatase [Microcella indica]MBU1251895.1 undecaprenyl-diphosphate phosphatase [Actinomycetota bacterium]MBU1609844.1 undecaprenyl-diphosphate phosphatase [Actinomycetota bacterium]MBU2315941.1 undecaprenyl-diphosphate phosphatase [Actinomycetota bacterium]MBU2385179.1 undecaprenyl-diphosphate phosphatase [Actinomycetota bacterium]
MSLLEALILGLIQGLTEFLPISSSAHLRIAGEVLPSATDPGATFTAITQIGTEAAVLVYFWKDITRIIGAWFRHVTRRGLPASDPDVRMGWLIIIGTVPIVIIGFLAQEYIRSAFRSLWLVAIVLIVFGILLGIADWLGRRDRELTQLTYPHGLAYGAAQTLALIPGVSRSGATTSMGLALGYTRPAAARYAFLLAVPAVFGSGFYELLTAIREPGSSPFSYVEIAAATVVAFGVGLAVIAGLMAYISKRSFLPFVIYRLLLGGTLLVLLATGVIDPL